MIACYHRDRVLVYTAHLSLPPFSFCLPWRVCLAEGEMDRDLLSFVLFGALVWMVVAVYLLICMYLLCSLCCGRHRRQETDLESSEVTGAEVVDVL